MKKFIIIQLFVFLILTANSQNNTSWEIYQNCNVYSSQYKQEDEIIFSAEAGEKIIPLNKHGNQDFKVKFENGQIGWINFGDIKEARIMIAEDSVLYYNMPNFSESDDKYFSQNDTLYFVEYNEEKSMVKVVSKNHKGWINENYFIPVCIADFAEIEYSDFIIDYDKFISKASELSDNQFEEKFNTPEAKIIKNNLTYSLFQNIILVKEKKYFYTFYLIYENNKFLKDSLIGTGKTKWIEKLPLSTFIRKISPSGINFNLNSKFTDAIDELKSENKFARIILNILKWIIVILIFLIPSGLAYLTFKGIIKIKFLKNKAVKILNWALSLAVFYFLFLDFILNIGYDSPIFFGCCIIVPFYIILKKYLLGFNRKNIDRYRCNSCGSFKTNELKTSTFISKKHDTEHYSWRENLGSSTKTTYSGDAKVQVTTNYYQQKGAVHFVTWMYYSDKMKCRKCGSETDVSRVEKKYGHI